jgi:superfamily II DNA or RNA helicase
LSKTVRDEIVKRLSEDLIGPKSPDEVLKSKPTDVYMTGILWPARTEFTMIEDDSAGEGESDDDGELQNSLPMHGQKKASSMGITFAVPNKEHNELLVTYSFGTYVMQINEETGNIEWKRKQHSERKQISITDQVSKVVPLELTDCKAAIDLHIRSLRIENGFAVTITMMNRSDMKDAGTIPPDSFTVFQAGLSVEIAGNGNFLGLTDPRIALDEDEESAMLLYSKSKIFAYGHQSSANWNLEASHCKEVRTEWIPTEKVPVYKQEGSDVFRDLVECRALNANKLSTLPKDKLIEVLKLLVQQYDLWIDLESQKIIDVPQKHKKTAERHINKCSEISARMLKGIDFLEKDENAFIAFQTSNHAMALQHGWKSEPGSNQFELEWRPFQIAFIILAMESVCNNKSTDRKTLDLLWFPTGGGKTEAYLALIAMGSIYRRMTQPDDGKYGNFAIMRYTLRLLTLQQFERASGLILALELIRKGSVETTHTISGFGEKPFSIGLWVGDDATKNKFADAEAIRGQQDAATAEQIRDCYVCRKPLDWIYNRSTLEIRPTCNTQSCILGKSFGIWPILTVDQDIYNTTPTVIIGTVDKFAQLPLSPPMGRLLGFRSPSATDLIIQDELHLISGPLGTIVGAYEMALDWLLEKNGNRCKVVGSTATIRRAQHQVRALFDRESCQFPPPGINFDDSGFAVVDYEKPGRLYVGVTTTGRSAKFMMQGVAASLLQSGTSPNLGNEEERDGYATLLMYFNALRELGGALVQVSDDVPDSIALYSESHGEDERILEAPRELTSKVSQREIGDTLKDLSKQHGSAGSVDVVLATNMVSVGVDVPRLGLMLVVGQPKTRSEYIQSTSRVGRSTYPGLVVCLLNAMKSRDQSHYETFSSWHRTIYRDVEATSVTPFASRSRDRVLKAVIVAMVRHSDPNMRDVPNLKMANPKLLTEIANEIERRAVAVAGVDVLNDLTSEIDAAMESWLNREVKNYINYSPKGDKESLLQTAENYAQKLAAGVWLDAAWPVMNTMRSVEAGSKFRLKESRMWTGDEGELPPWRRNG